MIQFIKDLFLPLRRFINGLKYPVSGEEKQLIENTDRDKLAVWYLELNDWGWPSELLPKDSDNYITGGRRAQFMKLITDKVGERFLLRKHNKDMSDDEFNIFWKENRLRMLQMREIC